MSSTEYIIAIKSLPLIIFVEFTKDETFCIISFLNSDLDISCFKINNKFIEQVDE